MDFDQAEITQRPLGRENIPRRIIEEGQGQRERREKLLRIVLRAGAQAGNTRVQFHRRAKEQHVLFEERQTQSLAQERQG